jgi:predicted nucleotidyltransferase
MPPMAFELLLEALLPSGPLRAAIDALLEKKRAAAEIEDGPRVPAISDFLDAELGRMGAAAPRRAWRPAAAIRGRWMRCSGS